MPIPNSTYFYGYSPEARSHCVDGLISKFSHNVRFVKIEDRNNDMIFEEFSAQNITYEVQIA